MRLLVLFAAAFFLGVAIPTVALRQCTDVGRVACIVTYQDPWVGNLSLVPQEPQP